LDPGVENKTRSDPGVEKETEFNSVLDPGVEKGKTILDLWVGQEKNGNERNETENEKENEK
jgi:hypothetical protein